jgi:UDP-GlcNAc:undecaprenyl-phosphate/decaprenyl-phosphate GlcNAc-1-phosphate transferase
VLDVRNVGPLLAIIAVGVCVGFLPHNFNPARIMMGDGGALFLGLLLAVSTSVVGGRADSFNQEFIGQTYFFLAPLVIPLLILGVPCSTWPSRSSGGCRVADRSPRPTRDTSTIV